MDNAFAPNRALLDAAVARLCGDRSAGPLDLPDALPGAGLGDRAALARLAPAVLGGAAPLGAATAFAHMDPPTPCIAWATGLWNAALNQNLLHPDTAPVARAAEARVVAWLAPYFGMDGGHMTAGSTLANLTALWAAREVRGVRRVVASTAAHLSVRKAAHLLGLDYAEAATDRAGALLAADLPDPSGACLVLTAGTTATGAIDPLDAGEGAAWVHVDAAWAGPLRLCQHDAGRLAGLERADSVAVSAHKWLFQPKESALVLFRDTGVAHAAVSFGGTYLAAPNIGVLGSHGAAGVTLLATLLSWGRDGLAERIGRCMGDAGRLAAFLAGEPRAELLAPPATGVVVWRPADRDVDALYVRLPGGVASRATIGGDSWLRHVAANPNAEVSGVIAAIQAAL